MYASSTSLIRSSGYMITGGGRNDADVWRFLAEYLWLFLTIRVATVAIYFMSILVKICRIFVDSLNKCKQINNEE